MNENPTLCLCMIAKDERKNIARCIQSVQGFASEIVVVDTGSTDDTPVIAESLGARVFNYAWDESFSNAKNFAIAKAQSDWLLLLDADEALDADSRPIIEEFIRTTQLDGAHLRIRNYTGRFNQDAYSLHSGFRLLRNHKNYLFRGSIHEQITADIGEDISSRFTTLKAIVHHYGYLEEQVNEKQKRKRNIPLLEKELERNPNDPFNIFNMGNEHLAMSDYTTALSYYQKAIDLADNRRAAYLPHAHFRIINCYEALGQYEKALDAVRAALKVYPVCTDFEFLRAGILMRLRKYALAIESLEICLKMGAPQLMLEFLEGCGTFRAAFQLGEIYLELGNDRRAVEYYSLALLHKPNLYLALYRAGRALCRLYQDKNEAAKKLHSFFADPKYAPNALVTADILSGERLPQLALNALKDVGQSEEYAMEIAYSRGRAFLLLDRLDRAREELNASANAPEPKKKVLRTVRAQCAKSLFVLDLIENDRNSLPLSLERIRLMCPPAAAAVAARIGALIWPEMPGAPESEEPLELGPALDLLGLILSCRCFELFEQTLGALNYVDSQEVLLGLARLYEEYGYPELAAETVLRSIREMDKIDPIGAGILFRQIHG